MQCCRQVAGKKYAAASPTIMYVAKINIYVCMKATLTNILF